MGEVRDAQAISVLTKMACVSSPTRATAKTMVLAATHIGKGAVKTMVRALCARHAVIFMIVLRGKPATEIFPMEATWYGQANGKREMR